MRSGVTQRVISRYVTPERLGPGGRVAASYAHCLDRAPPTGGHQQGEPMDAWLSAAVASVRDEVIDTRRQLHAAPELSMVEHDTSALVRDRLAEIGADLLECPTETGAVATIGDPDSDGPAVLVRADIDALPIDEDASHPFVVPEWKPWQVKNRPLLAKPGSTSMPMRPVSPLA